MKLLTALLAAAACAASAAAWGQGYPSRPIRIVTHSAPAGFEIYARMIAPILTESLGKPVVIENKVGANGNVAMIEVAKSAPDGHTILFAATGALTINTAIYDQMPFDPVTEFKPVVLAATVPMLWVASKKSDVRSMVEYIKRARANPGKMDFALAANGSLNHLVFEGLKQRLQLDIVTIAYKSTPGAQQDVIAGTIPVMVDSLGAASAHLRSGTMLPLAVTTKIRSEALPEVPTVMELGLDTREYTGWYGFLVPKDTPAEIVTRLNGEIAKALNTPAVVERIKAVGAIPGGGTPAEFGKFMADERDKWGSIARAANIRVQ
jgi:tripartite-type tricarboxylate transporter receptor subunit TctC